MRCVSGFRTVGALIAGSRVADASTRVFNFGGAQLEKDHANGHVEKRCRETLA